MRAWVVTPAIVVFGVFCFGQSQQPPSSKTPPTQQTSGDQPAAAAQRNVNGKAPGSPKVPGSAKPETGKAGQHATAINDTTTASTGVTTPPYNTNNGTAQQPGNYTSARTPPENPQPRPGAPPNWEQVGQLQGHADTNAAKAIEAEIGGAPGGGTLGINNVAPSYERNGQGAKARSTQSASPTARERTGKTGAKPSAAQPKTRQ